MAGPVEFEFEGKSVGLFEDAVPRAEGLYRYTPYRGFGHMQMQQRLKSMGSARCSYRDADSKVSFTVLECPKYGFLRLGSFEVGRPN